MLLKFSTLTSTQVRANEDELGKVKDVLFDDQSWFVRYLVVDTRKWLPGKKVLVSPQAAHSVLPDSPLLLDLTRQQVKDCPDRSEEEPISRQYEKDLHLFYGWAPYWGATGRIHPYGRYLHGRFGQALPAGMEEVLYQRPKPEDSHLRSCDELVGYQLNNDRGNVGSVSDFYLDAEGWEVPFLVVDTGDWLPGRKVTFPYHLVEEVNWGGREVKVRVPNEVIEGAPTAEEVEQAGKDPGILEHYYKQYVEAHLPRRKDSHAPTPPATS